MRIPIGNCANVSENVSAIPRGARWQNEGEGEGEASGICPVPSLAVLRKNSRAIFRFAHNESRK